MKKHNRLYPIFLEDITLIVVTLLIAISLISSNFTKKEGQMALIYVNNRLIQKVSLAKPRIIHYEKMIFEVNNNQIHVKASNCPEQICVHRGWINKRGQIIVCGPNHLLIEIDGSSEGKVYAPAL